MGTQLAKRRAIKIVPFVVAGCDGLVWKRCYARGSRAGGRLGRAGQGEVLAAPRTAQHKT